MKKTSIIAWLLIAVMLLSSLAGCNPREEITTTGKTEETTEKVSETQSETEGTTEKPTESEKLTETETESETEKATETESETEEKDVLDTTPLSLKPREDLFPDHSEYETSSVSNMPRVDIRVEAEDFSSSTIPWRLPHGEGSEFSNGIIIRSLFEAVDGWDAVYSVTYKVTVPIAGRYSFTVLSAGYNVTWTSDYTVTVNDQEPMHVLDIARSKVDFPSPSMNDNGLLKIIDMGYLELIEGENTIVFTLDNEDSQASMNRLSFFLDYFDLSLMNEISEGLKVSYDIGIRGQENSDIITAAANVNVFDCRYPIRFTVNRYFETSEEVPYTITDYFGNVVYEGVLKGDENDMVSVQRCVKNHPTGYFTLKCGDMQTAYVVTPSFAERTLDDSPFAMDFVGEMNGNVNAAFNLAAAARLSGVTWVRDRARWSQYEPTPGEYNFAYSEKYFKAIDKSGLKLLVDLCPSPKWAYASEGYTGTQRVGGFRTSQLAFYNMCKAMVAYYDGVVDAWELWNESDLNGFAVETSELFSAFYKAGALGVHDANPNMIVMLGGLCQPNTNSDYMHLTMLNDVLQYSNTFNYHNHYAQPSHLGFQTFIVPGSMAASVPSSLSLYNGLYTRPVWITEAGLRVDKTNEKEYNSDTYIKYIKQANYIVTSTVQSLSIGTDKHFWFLLSPYWENGDFGTFSKSFEPYPTLAAESVMTKVLGKAEYLGEPIGLSSDAYGYIFNNGTRLVSVLWSTKEGDKYIVETNAPIIVTDIMGNETLYEPESGKISLRLGTTPIYVTYSTAPEYYAQEYFMDGVIEPLTYTLGQRVVLSPEFENYNINDPDIKKNGHVVFDGITVKVRVTNYNDVAVTGTVSGTLMGFEVVGGDKEITVAPYSEGFVTLTLKKTGDEPINSYITFTGTFNGEKTSNSTAHVYTDGAADNGKLTINGVATGRYISKTELANMTAVLEGAEGTPLILINDKEFSNYTYENGTFNINLSELDEGRYTVTVAVETDGGDYIFKTLIFTFDGKKAMIDLYV